MSLAVGSFLKLAVRGESHAPSLRFTVENFPAGFAIDAEALRAFMERRAPGRDAFSTARKETDAVIWTGGVTAEGLTTGEPLCGKIANTDMRPHDYGAERTIPRPGHADFGQWVQTGRIPTGGGANSGRLTAALCGVGGVCLQFLATRGIHIEAKIEAIHGNKEDPDGEILKAKADGDSVGGTIVCTATGLRAGLGGALFDGIESALASALFAIPGLKGVEFGNGFEAALLTGSENNDAFEVTDGKVVTTTNRHGGLLGGRTTGMPLVFRVALKPTPTIFKPQPSVDLATMTPAVCEMKGRHDPCIVRRAVPVVEAVAAFVLADAILADEAARPRVCLTLTGKTLAEDVKQFERAQYFCDLVELRVDLLSENERARAAEFPSKVPVPVILTYRRTVDGGAFDGDEEMRKTFFKQVLANPGFAYVDFEDDFRDDELTALATKSHTRIIRSLHIFKGPVSLVERVVPNAKIEGTVPMLCRRLKGETNEIPKVAFMPQSEADVERFFEETKDFDDFPHILCAMGPLGLPTRVSAHRSHSFLTYTSLPNGGALNRGATLPSVGKQGKDNGDCPRGDLRALGHVTPHNLRRARKFAVLGHPVGHSLSPEMHRANFAALGFVATYEKFDVAPENLAETLKKLQKEGFSGVNLTIPHKVAVLPLLDQVDETVRQYGSCNTVRFEADGSLTGFNTDVTGFIETLSAHGFSLAGKNVLIFGRGGAGSALAACATAENAQKVSIFGRNAYVDGDSPHEIGGDCPRELKPEVLDLAREADLIVNATPVGLKLGDSPLLPAEVFRPGQVVLDIIPTRALPPTAATAQAAGATAIGGLEFLVGQGAKAFELWTGIPADRAAMISALGIVSLSK